MQCFASQLPRRGSWRCHCVQLLAFVQVGLTYPGEPPSIDLQSFVHTISDFRFTSHRDALLHPSTHSHCLYFMIRTWTYLAVVQLLFVYFGC